MATSRIIDPQTGKPFPLDMLTQEIAAPQMMGVRSVWQPSVANRLTPTRLAGLLQAADMGEAHEYLTLAEEMEERDLHYASVLGTRKLAVSGLDVRVDSASDNADDVRRADAVRELVDAPEFGEMTADLVDALGKSYAVSEIVWDRSGRTWWPEAYKARDQRFFRFDRVAGAELRLLDEADLLDGLPLAPYKFIVHLPRIRAGLPIRGGLARLAAVAYMCKSWAWKDWMAFADIYGLPMRVGKYGPGASDDDISTLMAAVANLGSDAAAAIPDSMKIEFESAGNTASAGEFFRGLAEWWDKQVSKGVIGQTMTADDGSSNSQAQVHDHVRLDILTADAKALSNTLNRRLVRPFVDLNYGPGRYPRLQIVVPRPENLKLLVDALGTLVPLGLKVEQSVIRDKLGLPDPDDNSELLSAPSTSPPPKTQAQNREQRALNAETDPTPDDVSRLVDQLDAQMGAVTDAWLNQVRDMVAQATSLDDVRDGLMALQTDMSLDDFAKGMREALDAAQALGRYDIMQEAGLG